NAALGCAQMESLPNFIIKKRELATIYKNHFIDKPLQFIEEPKNTKSNYWLNAIIVSGLEERNAFLEQSNDNGVMTRPIWKLMNKLSIYNSAQIGNLENSEWLEDRIINIPSSVRV